MMEAANSSGWAALNNERQNDAIREASAELAEKTVKLRKEYELNELKKLGYSREYVREHRRDFVTVYVPWSVDLACMVYVPEARVLFWYERKYESKQGELTRIAGNWSVYSEISVSYRPYTEPIPDGVRVGAVGCALDAVLGA